MFKSVFVVSCLLVAALATPLPEDAKPVVAPATPVVVALHSPVAAGDVVDQKSGTEKKTDKRHAVYYDAAPALSYNALPVTSYNALPVTSYNALPITSYLNSPSPVYHQVQQPYYQYRSGYYNPSPVVYDYGSNYHSYPYAGYNSLYY